MKKKLMAWMMVIVMCAMTACSSSTDDKPTEDGKPTESETTNGDIVGEDAESQLTTPEKGEGSDKKGEDEKTSGDDKQESSSGESTSKNTETGTTQKATATAEPGVSTKPAEITTKPAETTTKPVVTTTEKPTTTTAKPTTTTAASSGNGDSGSIELDIKPTAAADTAAGNIVSAIINPSMSQYNKVKAIHDWLVVNVNYDNRPVNTLSDTVYTAEGALCNRLAVCQGYAEAFELLCAKAGIQAYMIYGSAGNDTDGWTSHSWNVVRIDGEWYQIDCTWDDPLMDSGVITDGSNITYQYFLLTDKEMYVDHVVNNQYTENLKVCTSTLYKGYAEKLSVEAAMDGCSNSSIVATADELKSVVKSYVNSNIFEFSIAVPQSVENSSDIIMQTLSETLSEKGVVFHEYGSKSGIMRDVCSYVVYINLALYYQ